MVVEDVHTQRSCHRAGEDDRVASSSMLDAAAPPNRASITNTTPSPTPTNLLDRLALEPASRPPTRSSSARSPSWPAQTLGVQDDRAERPTATSGSHRASPTRVRCRGGCNASIALARSPRSPATSPAQYPAGSGVGVSVLLRQAHGFEGFRLVQEALHLHDLSFAQRVDASRLAIRLRYRCPSPCQICRDDDADAVMKSLIELLRASQVSRSLLDHWP